MLGWSGETSSNVWRKASIELDSDDLARLLREYDLDAVNAYDTHELYELLDLECERLLTVKVAQLVGASQEETKSRLSNVIARRDALVVRLKI
jgi:hypothetical protein